VPSIRVPTGHRLYTQNNDKMDDLRNSVHIHTDGLHTQVGKYVVQLQMETGQKGTSAYCEVRNYVADGLWLGLQQ